MKKSKAIIYTTLILILFVWGLASGANVADPKSAGAKITVPSAGVGKAADVKTDESKTAEVKPMPPYKYNPTGKADPFKPFLEQDLAAKKKMEKAKPLPLSPLQRAGLNQFKLVGIAGDEQSKKAIVQDMRGKIYPIFIGTYIGLNNGRVVEILTDRVIVEEQAKARAGKTTKANRVAIKLRKEEGEE